MPLLSTEIGVYISVLRSPDGVVSPLLYIIFLIRMVGVGGVQTRSTRHVAHFWPIVPLPRQCEDGAFGGMNIGTGN
jgi:hypothetical protein